MKTLLGYKWFKQMDNPFPIGIVITRNEEYGEEAFIGMGSLRYENDPIGAASDIGKTGASFPLDLAKKLIEI
jgi:hypothetical protein